MKIKLHIFAVRTNATTTIEKPYAAYEGEILGEVHGPENVIDKGEIDQVYEIESVDAEAERLARLYGAARLQKLYGSLLKGLKSTIAEAEVKPKTAKATK